MEGLMPTFDVNGNNDGWGNWGGSLIGGAIGAFAGSAWNGSRWNSAPAGAAAFGETFLMDSLSSLRSDVGSISRDQLVQTQQLGQGICQGFGGMATDQRTVRLTRLQIFDLRNDSTAHFLLLDNLELHLAQRLAQKCRPAHVYGELHALTRFALRVEYARNRGFINEVLAGKHVAIQQHLDDFLFCQFLDVFDRFRAVLRALDADLVRHVRNFHAARPAT